MEIVLQSLLGTVIGIFLGNSIYDIWLRPRR